MKRQSLEYRRPQIQSSTVPIHFENTPPVTVTVDRTHRTAATWHNRSARSLKEAMELFWPWLQRVNQLRSFPSRSHLQGCPNVPRGTPDSNKCPFPANHFFHNISKTAIHFTRASTQRNNLGSEMCAKRSYDGKGAVCGIRTTHWYYRRARFQNGRDRWHCCHLVASQRVLVVNVSSVFLPLVMSQVELS